MNIVSNVANFNIHKINSIKNDYCNRVVLPKSGMDKVSFGANVQYEKAKNIFSAVKKSKRVGILVHKDVDADAVSSGILFLNMLKRRYKDKDIQFIVNQKIPKYLANTPDLSVITQYKDLQNKYFDTVAVLDCDETRVDCYDIFKNAKVKINIDHHGNREKNPLFSNDLRIVNPKSASTTQLIYDNFFIPFGIWPNRKTLECIMTGIITDTGNFKNIPDVENFSKSMKSLSQYTDVPLSVWSKKINNKFSSSKQRSEELKRFFDDTVEFGKNLNTHITPKNNKINYVLVTQELLDKYNIKDDEADIKEVLNHIVTIYRPKFDISVTLWERKNGEVRLSMRSNNHDVLSIAEKLDGGGHKFAAGSIMSGNFQEVLEKVLSVIDEKY